MSKSSIYFALFFISLVCMVAFPRGLVLQISMISAAVFGLLWVFEPASKRASPNKDGDRKDIAA